MHFHIWLREKCLLKLRISSIEVADYFHEQGNLMLSNEYYRMSIEARRKIKKGEIINENQPDSIGSSDFK